MDINKILITVYVPFFNDKFDIFIPINKKVGTIKEVLIKSINEMSNNNINNIEKLRLYDKETCKVLDNNIYINNSELSNGSSLILL